MLRWRRRRAATPTILIIRSVLPDRAYDNWLRFQNRRSGVSGGAFPSLRAERVSDHVIPIATILLDLAAARTGGAEIVAQDLVSAADREQRGRAARRIFPEEAIRRQPLVRAQAVKRVRQVVAHAAQQHDSLARVHVLEEVPKVFQANHVGIARPLESQNDDAHAGLDFPAQLGEALVQVLGRSEE